MHDDTSDTSADFDPQGATARPGGQAEGGITAKPGDSASPAQAGNGDETAKEAMRRAGFGDDKGGDIS
jgi:hypothetical protein